MIFDFEKLFMAAPTPFVLLDRDLRMVWANDAYLDVTGRTRATLIGRVMTEEFPSEPNSVHGQMLRKSLQRVLKTGVADHLPLIPYPIPGPNGQLEERYWSATHTPVQGADGKTEFVLQNTDDVTDLYRAKPQLTLGSAEKADIVRRAEAVTRQNLELGSATEFFQLVFRQAPTFMAILAGPDHEFRIVNDAYLRVVGRRDLIGKPVRYALPEVEDQGFIDLLDQVYRSGEAVTLRGAAISLQRDSSEPPERAYLDFVYQPLFDEHGSTTGIFVQGHDVTAQREAEIHLREAEARFRTMAQTMPSHVWTAQPNGRLDWLSDLVYTYTGRQVGELYGARSLEVVHPEDRRQIVREWFEALENGQTYETEFRIRRHDGEYRWHLSRARPIRDERGTILRWVGTNADIDEQRAISDALADLNATLEERVARRNRELEDVHARLRQSQKMEAIGNLSGGIAHDFNNLLQAITGSLTLAARELDEEHPVRERLDAAMRAVDRAAGLSSQLLAFSRRQPLQPKALNLHELLQGMHHILGSAVGEEIDIEIEADEDLWPTYADPANTESALLNLAVNARDAMAGRGRLKIELRNRVVTEKEVADDSEMSAGEYVEIKVTDNGSGMTAETAEKVFEPFFTTKPVGKGTGLGLPTVYGFARQSGGRAAIESEVGLGTTVTLMLPRSAQAPDAAGCRNGDAAARGTERILLVEDDNEVRTASADLLTDLGYSVHVAAGPDAALEMWEKGERFDLLISDVLMPGMITSREMVERMHLDRPDLPVLFISGYSRDEILHNGRVGEGIQFLSKPFSQDAIAAKVREVLDAAGSSGDPQGGDPLTAGAELHGMRVLVCEDEIIVRTDLADMLTDSGATVATAGTRQEALDLLKTQVFDVLLTDIGLPDGSGEDLAYEGRELQSELSVIFATGRQNVAAAQELANCVVLYKPFSEVSLTAAFRRLKRIPEAATG